MVRIKQVGAGRGAGQGEQHNKGGKLGELRKLHQALKTQEEELATEQGPMEHLEDFTQRRHQTKALT